MSLLVLAAAAASLPGHVIARPPAKPCAWALRQAAEAKRQKPGVHKLGEMPPANQVLTVYREVDGCPTPVVVRYGVRVK